MLALSAALACTHVPILVGKSACVHPVHPAVKGEEIISQAAYLRGAGGLELAIYDDVDPFDVPGGYLLPIDVVFRDKVDLSSFKLYVGCGSCDPDDAATRPPEMIVDHLGDGTVEPFSQSNYWHALHGDQLKFNTSALALGSCADKRFAIRLETNESLYWSAVVGVRESFTFTELLSYPAWILGIHGAYWNDLWFTSYVVLFLLAFWIVAWRFYPAMRAERAAAHATVVCDAWSAQQFFYDLAFLGFGGAFLEELVHLLYAQGRVPASWGFWVGLFFVALAPNGSGFWLAAWSAVDAARPDRDSRGFALATFFAGLFLFLVFGAGFYLGPTGLCGGSLMWILRAEGCKSGYRACREAGTVPTVAALGA